MMDGETINLYKNFWTRTVKRNEHMRDLGSNGRSILELISNEIHYYDVDCIHLGQNRYQ